ncbi:MAG: hypothetical protein AB1393_00360 [Candidatus Edwardsbacteria bacterium]
MKAELYNPFKGKMTFEISSPKCSLPAHRSILGQAGEKSHHLFGRVTDFRGRAIQGYVIVNPSEGKIGTKCRKDGSYHLYLPGGRHESIAAFALDYGRKTLESWAWNIFLDRKQLLNFRIGRLEIYRMHAWRAERTLNISFRPMSLTKILQAVKEGKNELEACAKKYSPQLRKEDVKIFINYQECRPKLLISYPEYIATLRKKTITIPAYLAQVELNDRSSTGPRTPKSLGLLRNISPVKSKTEVKLFIRHKIFQNNKIILEEGEGITWI